jgi:FkbM family methyltransferase
MVSLMRRRVTMRANGIRRRLSLMSALWRAAPGRVGARSLSTALALAVRQRRGSVSGRPLPVVLRAGDVPFTFHVSDFSQLKAMHGVLVDRHYAVPADLEPEVILDFGSNVGASIAFFHATHPGAVIHGFEPDPRTFALLHANVGALPGVVLHQVAVAGVDGTRPFHLNAHSWASSLRQDWPTQSSVPVSCRTIRSLMTELGVTRVGLVKLDVEGSEIDVLEAFPDAAAMVDCLIGELHTFIPGLEEAPDRLRRALPGFTVDLNVRENEVDFLARRTPR